MSLNKKTGKYHQAKGKKHSFNFDEDTQDSFIFVQHTLESINNGNPVTKTDTVKWMVRLSKNILETEIARASKQHQ